ncbi:AarF/UbiB family protein [Actinotalea sp. M2MS4P-6]|uniref:ABC1 kinase family protein n=1 Tax=Actinotalea sp. M2MS4P-6 TaxID=2983762 RepID=UPI0021E3CD6C|nr:AarF/UbiB family protein [Actinotalea sp. M2MS4P-6]MCV2395243.1 AarF/UbiB family protein [Actinotalea sp. M2MS4P-6]
MTSSRLRGRYLHILTFFAGMITRFIWFDLVLRRIGFAGRVRRGATERYRREAVRFRALAIRMGGVMIKIGQFLSSRLDVLPREVTAELANLQDEVPAEDFADIRALAEAELGAPLSELFASVETVPLAAASLGQVHRATLTPEHEAGFRDVVIKVQRTGIKAIVDTDLAALARVGRWLMRYRPIRAHADVPALLREFAATLYEEIDYRLEADHADQFRANLADDPGVQVPRVVRELSAQRVLTLEDVSAIKITDYAAITAAGIDRADVASRLLDVYLRQVFEDGFVHADPHPGNIFVTPGPDGGADGWRLTFVDFGMVARIPDGVRVTLRELVVAVGTRDASRVVKAYQQLGMLLPGADVDAIERAEAAVFDRYWGMSMSELRNIDPDEVRQFAHQYRDLLLDLPFQVPQDLIYVVRTVAILSGMCTGLEPDFNVWEELAPYARRLVADEATSGIGAWVDEILDALMASVALPGQLGRVLAQAETKGLAVRDEQGTRALRSVGRAVDRLSGAVLTTGLLVAASVLVGSGYLGAGVGLFVAAGLGLVWVLAAGTRR